jgi:hypothetical protein
VAASRYSFQAIAFGEDVLSPADEEEKVGFECGKDSLDLANEKRKFDCMCGCFGSCVSDAGASVVDIAGSTQVCCTSVADTTEVCS